MTTDSSTTAPSNPISSSVLPSSSSSSPRAWFSVGTGTAIAGGLAGVTVDFILFPLDTLKTRLQARKIPGKVIHGTGIKSFYKGLFFSLAGGIPGAATFWTFYEGTKKFLLPSPSSSESSLSSSSIPSSSSSSGNDHRDTYTPQYRAFSHAVSAVVAEIAVGAVRTPFEVIKSQMQAGIHSKGYQAIQTILQKEGYRGLYTGYGSTFLRDIPFDIIQFTLYEELKKRLQDYKKEDLVVYENAILGSISGGLSAAVTTPLDVIKTRLQTQAGSSSSSSTTTTGTSNHHHQRYKGVLDAFIRIRREEGWKTLFAGIRPRVAWISIGGAIFIGSFEEFRRQLT